MKVWKMTNHDDDRITLKISDNIECIPLDSMFKGKPISLDCWNNFKVDILHPSKKVSDAPHCWELSGSFTLRENALNILFNFISPNAQILPLYHKDYNFYACNTVNVVDCLIEEKSDITRFKSGRIMNINSPVFDKSKVKGQHLFKIPQELGSYSYVSNEFKKAVEKHNLKGFNFIEVKII